MNSDVIFLDRMAMRVRIGTTERERAEAQPVVLSVRLHTPLGAAGRSDSLEKSVDYAAIEREIRSLAEHSRYNLVEALAEAVAARILEMGGESVWVRVEKKVLPSVESVGVELWRHRA
jgi:FolB domain-containing protein